MYLKKMIMLGVTALSVGVGFGATQTTAKAAINYMPKSWRGYYHTSSGRGLKITTHSVSFDGKTFYKSSAHGWRRIHLQKVANMYHHPVYELNNAKVVDYLWSYEWWPAYRHGRKVLLHKANMGNHADVWYKD